MSQVILTFLPGYMWNGDTLVSTGVALPPTQHVNPRTGEVCFYVRPVSWVCGAYIRRQGIIEYLDKWQLSNISIGSNN